MEDISSKPRGRPRGILANRVARPATEAAEPVTDRHEMRPQMREDDPRSRAAQRAAELRGHLGDIDEGTDRFYVDPDSIPEGWTYNWKRFSSYELQDTANQLRVKREGWTPVPAGRHPEMMPQSASAEDIIMRDGLVLMECPTEIVRERQFIELKRARDQVRYKEQQLAGTPEGTLTRDHALVRPKINKSYAPIPIPDE